MLVQGVYICMGLFDSFMHTHMGLSHMHMHPTATVYTRMGQAHMHMGLSHIHMYIQQLQYTRMGQAYMHMRLSNMRMHAWHYRTVPCMY